MSSVVLSAAKDLHVVGSFVVLSAAPALERSEGKDLHVVGSFVVLSAAKDLHLPPWRHG